ncbi:MAG: hypothetical protein ABR68_04695 [Microbacteriaceae bacterium BACL28 MAG-120531-bin53]|jgi:riboflavin biosynthesis pyrimidine reductase|uniref:hypothetical protein n=1 Tax=Aquiluna sp. TaxID=2053504 RepID=UPI0007128F31|nr:MAG: hypothetical protein ABR68_04695 [Microbacteriaceae bacterium BACL28 MAG-120531-bin53]|tara:strand:+ start:143 stop:685 length:543 start_codon:yes stop_codon:yes gene_type:complete
MPELLSLIGDPLITASMVVDGAGSHIGPDGTSKSLGGESDFELLMLFRKRAGTVLTTGLTARSENYRLPSSSALAILTRSAIETLPKDLQVEQVRLIGNETSLTPDEAVQELLTSSSTPIHIEFGPTALSETLRSRTDVRAFISSEFPAGAATFISKWDLLQVGTFRFKNLYVTEVSGRV